MNELAALRTALSTIPPGSLVPVDWVRSLLEGTDDGTDPTVEDVAQALDRAPSTIRGWCRDGRLPGAYRLRGREWRIPREALRALREDDPGHPNTPRAHKRSLRGWREVAK